MGPLGHGGVEPKGDLDEGQIVIDGLRHSDHGDLKSTFLNLVAKLQGSTESAITPYRDKNVDIETFK